MSEQRQYAADLLGAIGYDVHVLVVAIKYTWEVKPHESRS